MRALLALAAVLLAAAPAAAAPPWSAPQRVSGASVREPALGFGTGATGVGTLRFNAASTRIVSVADRPGTRDVASVQDGPLAYAQTRTVSLRRRAAGRHTTLGWSFGRQSGAVGAMRSLRTVVLRPGEAELAVSPAGHAVIAFVEERYGRSRVWLSTRRAGSPRFSTPRVIRGSGSPRSLAVSVDDRGRFVLAYAWGLSGRRTVEARLGTTAGTVGELQTIGAQLGRASVAAVIAPTGRATVAWATHDLGEEQNDPTQLRTNVAPAGRATFAGQVVLDAAAPGAVSTEPAAPSLAAAADGTTLVGYTLSGRFDAVLRDALTPARVSVQDRAARFGAPQELSADGAVGQVAARADGTFAVPYAARVTFEEDPSPLLVSLGTTTFGPGELVAEDAGAQSAAAFDAAGRAAVLYTGARFTGASLARRPG